MKKKKIEVEKQIKTEEEQYQEQLKQMEEDEKFSFWKLLKEAWSNKRYRAMIILVFLVYIFIYCCWRIKTSSRTNTIKKSRTRKEKFFTNLS